MTQSISRIMREQALRLRRRKAAEAVNVAEIRRLVAKGYDHFWRVRGVDPVEAYDAEFGRSNLSFDAKRNQRR